MALTQKEIKARFYARRKGQGVCLGCGKPLDCTGSYCTSCRNARNLEVRQTRKWYQSHGICPRCCKNELLGDEKSCPECRAKASENATRRRERVGKDEINQKHAEWAKKEHQRRIEQGICTRCGKRIAENGYKTCGICREKIRNYKRIKYGKPNRSVRTKLGLCYFCDNPVKEGYKVCEKHYQMNVEKSRSKKAKESRDALRKENILY